MEGARTGWEGYVDGGDKESVRDGTGVGTENVDRT